MLKDLCRASVEGMTDVSGSNSRRDLYKEVIASILALIISIIIVAFIGKWLWNSTAVELFTVVRPVRSIWQLVGLIILVSLFK